MKPAPPDHASSPKFNHGSSLWRSSPIEKPALIDAIHDGTLPARLANVGFDALVSVGETIADMNNHGGIDALSYISALNWSAMTQQEQLRMTYVLEGFASALKETPSRIYSFFHSVRGCLSNIGPYKLDEGFQKWAAANEDQLAEIAVLFGKGEYDSPFLGSLLQSWRNLAPTEALASALEFSGDARPAMRRQAILALGRFGDLEKSEEAAVETRLVEIVTSGETGDQRTAIAAIIRRLEKQSHKSPLLVSTLESAASEPSHEIRHELALLWQIKD